MICLILFLDNDIIRDLFENVSASYKSDFNTILCKEKAE